MNKLLPFSVLFLLALSSFASAKPPKNLEIFDRDVYVIEPHMELVLALTDDQQARIETELESSKSDPEVMAAKSAADADPSVRTALYRSVDAARERYLDKVGEILNDDQDELVAKIDDLAKRINSDYKGEIAAVIAGLKSGETKWSEKLEIVRRRGREHLPEVLTPEQIALVRPDGEEEPPSE